MAQSQIQCNRYKMFRSIAGVFIVSLAIQANFAFIDYLRETVTLKLSDKDLVQTIPVSNHKVYAFNVKRCILDKKLKRATYNSTKELIPKTKDTIEESFSTVNSLPLAITGRCSVKFKLKRTCTNRFQQIICLRCIRKNIHLYKHSQSSR